MDRLVELLKIIGGMIFRNVACEMLLVLLVIFLVEVFHVFSNVSTKDTLTVHIGVVLLGITVVSRESFLGVGNVESSIRGSLESSKDAISCSCCLASNIQEASEGAFVIIDLVHEIRLFVVLGAHNLTVDFGVSLVDIIESELGQQTTSNKKAGAVGGGVVLQTNLESVAGKLLGSSLAQDAISVNEGIGDLANHLLVGESNDKTVLGGLVLVLVLSTQALALTVVGSALAAATKLHLVTGEVGPVLLDFDESLFGRDKMKGLDKE